MEQKEGTQIIPPRSTSLPKLGTALHSQPHTRSGSPSGAAPVYRSPTSPHPSPPQHSPTSQQQQQPGLYLHAEEHSRGRPGPDPDSPRSQTPGVVRRASLSSSPTRTYPTHPPTEQTGDRKYSPADENSCFTLSTGLDPGLTQPAMMMRTVSGGEEEPKSPSATRKTVDEVIKERVARELEKEKEKEKTEGASGEISEAEKRHHAEMGGPHLG